MSEVFRPKWDWWQLLILVALPAAVVLPVLAVSTASLLFKLLLGTAVVGMVVVLLSVRYEAGPEALVVVFGPIRLTYPWADVRRVRKGGWWAQVSSFREPRTRMAFSVDNLIVECRGVLRARRVVISPADQARFLQVVRERAPRARIEGFRR